MTNSGFFWKTIEEKPEDWETTRLLVEDGLNQEQITSSTNEKTGDVFLLYDYFLEKNQDICFLLNRKKEEKGAAVSKKKKLSAKEMIHLKVEKEMIIKEFGKFQLDKKNWKPIRCKFQYSKYMICFYIIWWNHKLMKQIISSKQDESDKKIKHACLDAILSLNQLRNEIKKQDGDVFIISIIEKTEEYMLEKKREIYKNYSLLFEYPRLLYHSFFQESKTIRTLYKEQRDVLNKICGHIKENIPLLVGNQMPTGSGKTFLSVPLARRISIEFQNKKIVLFCCPNELVNQDVARTALFADDLHLWLAKTTVDPETNQKMIRIRPHKRCFPASWKKIYKETTKEKNGTVKEQYEFYVKATGRIPNMIVADVASALSILQEKTVSERTIAYIDEFITDHEQAVMMEKMSKYFPRHTILLSSILPSFEEMKDIVEDFCKQYDTSIDICLYRVETLRIPISCAVIDKEGRLCMPHHYISTQQDCIALCEQMVINPRLRRMYVMKYVYLWSLDIHDLLEPVGLGFESVFPNVCFISNYDIIDYALELLIFLRDNWNEETKIRFQQYRPCILPPFDTKNLFGSQSIYLEEKTLYVSDHLFEDVQLMTDELFEHYSSGLKWSSIVQKNQRNRDVLEKECKRLEMKKMNKNDKSMVEHELSEVSYQLHETIPKEYIINTKEHFHRFHVKNYKNSSETSLLSPQINFKRIYPFFSPSFHDSFQDQWNLWFCAGIGIYHKTKLTEHQRQLIMSQYQQYSFLCSDKDIVFGTNLPNLCTIVIDPSFLLSQPISHLYQLMGRVGRIGKSYHATILIPSEEGIKKMMSF